MSFPAWPWDPQGGYFFASGTRLSPSSLQARAKCAGPCHCGINRQQKPGSLSTRPWALWPQCPGPGTLPIRPSFAVLTMFFWHEEPTDHSSPFTPPAPGTARKGSTQGSPLPSETRHFAEVSDFFQLMSPATSMPQYMFS